MSMEFRGFLKDPQDRDSLHKDSRSKLKGHAEKAAKSVLSSRENNKQFNYLRNLDAFDPISSSFLNEEKLPDATSEKDLGNEYYKQKKFLEAIECYSRSIGFAPTSVAFANRAMAYLKVKKFAEAENDCTDALNLDDRYVKAYSRRATSRKELMKLKEAMEDAEFAVRLEPNNPEIRKQYSEIKEMLGRKFIQNASEQKKSNAASKESQVKGFYPVTSKTQTAEASTAQTMDYEANTSSNPVISLENVDKRSFISIVESINDPCSLDGLGENVASRLNTSFAKDADTDNHSHELGTSMQDIASRAAALVMATAPKKINTPTSAYQFEVSWRSLSNESGKQTQLLKTIPPVDLPKIFKNALSSSILIDIIRCISTFFRDDTILAVSMIDYLTKVPRFDMIILCLSAMDRAELHRIWEEVFASDKIAGDLQEALNRLRLKYCC